VRHCWSLLVLGVVLGASSLSIAASDAELWHAAGVSPATRSMTAPRLSLRDMVGNEVSLAQFRGRVVMLYFWATW
jgi:cytochrome oxidase Cu insertion factor (SCO1/SenC/PrrC family)